MRVLVWALVLLLPTASADLFATNEEISTGVNNVEYAFGGAADGKAYAAFGQAATTYTTSFVGALAADHAPGTWDVHIHLSCDRPTAYRPTSTAETYRPTLSATLLVGGAQVGVGYGESTARTCDGPDDIWELTFPFDVTEATRAAGTEVRLDVNVWWLNTPPGQGQNGYFVLGAEATRISGMALADAGPGTAEPIQGPLNGTELMFTEPTSATYHLWHNATASQQLTVLGAGPGAAIQVLDAAGELLYNASMAANETALLNGTAGNWTVVVALVDFVGDLQVDLAPHAAQSGGDPNAPNDASQPVEGTAGGAPDGSMSGNSTTDEPGSEPAEDAPGLPLAAVLALLAFAARRRR